MPSSPERPRRVRLERGGPMLVEGPVTVTGDDGREVTSHRFVVAICTCRRSRSYPWCDTSHRRRVPAAAGTPPDGCEDGRCAREGHDVHEGHEGHEGHDERGGGDR